MSAARLREAADALRDAAYIPGLGPRLPESLAILLENEANAMDSADNDFRGLHPGFQYNGARRRLLSDVADAALACVKAVTE